MLAHLLKKMKDDSFYGDLMITFAGQMIVMLLGFLLNKLISNQYDVLHFGLYNLIRRTIIVLSFVMLMAMGIAIPKYVAEAKAKDDRRLLESYFLSGLSIIIMLSIILTLVMWLGRDSVAQLIFNDKSLSIYIFPMCLYAFSNCLLVFLFSVYRGLNNFIRYSVINIAMQLLLIIAVVLLPSNLFLLYNVWGYLFLLYAIVELFIIILSQQISFRGFWKKLFTLKELLNYSWPRVPGEFVLFAYNLIPLIIVSYQFGKEQVGYFSVALSITSMITPLFSLVGTILLPLVSRSQYDGTKESVNKKIKLLSYIYLLLGMFSIIFIMLWGSSLITLLFSPDYITSLPLVKIIILSILPQSMYLLLRNPIDAKSTFPYNTIVLLISFIIYILLLLVSSSIEVAAWATVFSYVVLGILSSLVWFKLKKQ